MNLQGQVALVTGAGRRIGRAIALRLAAEGARMVLHYRSSQSEAEAVAAEIVHSGGEAACIQAELTRVVEIDRLFEEIEQRLGRLDILVNNAAIFSPTPVGRTQESQWDAILDTNLKAQFFAAQRAAPLLAQSGRGRIINFASLGGLQAWPQYTAYGVSKAGVIMLTRCLARALAPAVTVNAIAPGTISFPDDAREIAERAIRSAPLRRTGSADDITNAVIYLVGAGFVTGQVLVVDGGSSIPS
ncbi:MAG: short-chain dehydrogenase [Acidobacteria bacterium]|nr:MAG: short-chain dehydrogenase [Acidobacteriota bacterium]